MSGATALGAIPRPLAGVRVIDFGQIVAMPLAGQWMAMLGADVIMVESRANLPSRSFSPFAPEMSPNTSGIFNSINRNKRVCTINLRTADGIALARRLVATADVAQDNFSPGTMDKLGLGYEALRAVKSNIITLSLCAFGNTGPWAGYAALHSGVMLLSGLTAVTGYPGGHPRMIGSLAPDPLASTYCVLAITQAIYHLRRTGDGQKIDAAMSEALQTLFPDALATYAMLGREPERIGNRHPRKAPHGIYRTRGDDTWVAVSVDGDAEWGAFCTAADLVALAADPRFATTDSRQANVEALDAAVTAWTREREAGDIARTLQAAGIAAGPVLNARDVLTDPHLRERGFIVEDDHPVAGRRPMAGAPWRFRRIPPVAYRHAPLLGADNEAVFGELLGMSGAEIARLEAAEVIY